MIKRTRARIRFASYVRESFVEADGDSDVAMTKFEEKVTNFGLDPATIIWLVKLAYEIYKLWQSLDIEASDAAHADIPRDIMRQTDDERIDAMGEVAL